MEALLLIVIIVGCGAIVALMGYAVGYSKGLWEGAELANEVWLDQLSNYPTTSQPIQQSGTHTPERGSDDTE